MNIVRWNEPFLSQHLVTSPNHREKFREMLIKSPLFIHDIGSEEWQSEDHPEVYEDNDLIRTPFENFRATITNRWDAGEYTLQKETGDVTVHRNPNPAWTQIDMVVFTFTRTDGQKTKAFLFKYRAASLPMIMHEMGHVMVYGEYDLRIKRWRGAVRTLDGNEVSNQDGQVMLLNYGRECLTKFCIDFLNPHFYAAEVLPRNRCGKSVEWVRQRTHFVLVHKTHSANRRDAIGIIVQNEKEHIHRMAHARRAHFRMLRSERFKNKRGQQVFVKSSWVGPKEWEDASGQTYRLIEKKIPQITQ